MIQVRDFDDNRIGTVIKFDGNNYQTVCSDQGLTHTNRNLKDHAWVRFKLNETEAQLTGLQCV